MDNVIYAAVYFAVTLGAFLIGKYVCPNIPKTVTDKLGELSEWAAKRPGKRRWRQLWSS